MTGAIEKQRAVLIVDDSVFMRKRVRQSLDQEGYSIVEATTGVSALVELEKRTFDCILTDLLMPELDGFGLLAELQRRRISVPVVVVTADVQKTTCDRCKELGAVELIQKPPQPERLRQIVADILGGADVSR